MEASGENWCTESQSHHTFRRVVINTAIYVGLYETMIFIIRFGFRVLSCALLDLMEIGVESRWFLRGNEYFVEAGNFRLFSRLCSKIVVWMQYFEIYLLKILIVELNTKYF